MSKYYTKNRRVVNALLLAAFPFIMCLVRALIDRESLFNVWFAGSNWQDDLVYYTLTKDVIKFGIPQGYFGFNENCAQYLTFAAWSPLLLIFYSLWGLVFGWNILAPVLCNILVFSVALFLFAYLVRIEIKEELVLMAILFISTPIYRFICSCMSEIAILSVLTVFLGLTVSLFREYKKSTYVWSLIHIVLLTLMRPYLVMFALFTFCIVIKHKKKWYPVVLTGIGSIVLYFLENKLLAPEYFDDYFRTDWITSFFIDGFSAGISTITGSINFFGGKILSFVWPGVRYGKDGIQAYYGVFILFAAGFVVYAVLGILRRQKDIILTILMAICFIAMFFAIVLMYKVDEGYRHTLLYIFAGILILVVSDKGLVKNISLGAVIVLLVWVFFYKADNNYYYVVSYEGEGVQMVADIERQLAENMELTDGVSWDNSVIWVSADYIPDRDEYEETLWRMLYGLPAGYGLNICAADYVNEHIDTLKSGYIATVPGGTVELNLLDTGALEVARNEYFVMYDIRNR